MIPPLPGKLNAAAWSRRAVCRSTLFKACLLGCLGLVQSAHAQTVFTRTPIGSLAASPSSSYSGTPANILDGNTNAAWVSNFTYNNVFQFRFDPNLDGQYTTADLFRLAQLKVYPPVGSSWALKTFTAETLAYGDTVWKPLYSGSATYPNYNFASRPTGGALTTSPSSSYSGTPANVIDATANTAWVSNFSMRNVFELAFDPNLNGTTGLAGDTADRFSLDRVAISNGNSSWSLHDFTLQARRNGGATWEHLFSSTGTYSNYNFAAAAQGGTLMTAPATAYSGTSSNVFDSTTNTAWVSNFSMNNSFTLNFDPNLNGVTSVGGDTADRYTISSVALNNGNSSWSLQDFVVDVKRNGSSSWQHLFASNGTIASYNYATTPNGGALVSSPASAYSGTPAAIIDDTINTAWVSNFSMYNVFEFNFDPNLDGVSGANGDTADRFTTSSLALNNGNSSWSLKDFRVDVKRNGGSTWLPLYSASGTNSAYNYASSPTGGALTSAPSSAYSGTAANIIDRTTNTAWVSNFSMANTFELAFDPNLNGTTGAAGDTADRFTLDTVVINNGNSSWSLKDFRLDVKRNGGASWQPLYSATGTDTNYNFAAAAKGGSLVAAPSSAYSGAASDVFDSSTNTAWVSNFSMNNVFELVFDPNLDGTTGLAGDNADLFPLSNLRVNNGNSSWSLKDFRVDVKRSGVTGWTPLYSANTTYAAYNFAATATGGTLVSSPASAYSGVPGNIIDSSTNTAWVSNFSMSNLFEFAFDPTLSGASGYLINTLTEVTLNNGGSSWALKDFQIWVNVSGSWSLAGTFTAAQTSATQTFTLTPVSNVSGVRLQTVSNYGGSVLQINEFEIHGSYTGGNPVFSAAQSSSTQTFDLTVANAGNLSNVTSLRLTTLNNFGGSVLQINEFEVRGTYTGNNPVFSATQSGSNQSFSLAAANVGNLSGIDAVRLRTLNNFGGSVLQINEFEALGSFTGSNPVFTATQSSATQSFDLTAANSASLSGIDAVRLTTWNNFGGSVLQINEFEVRGAHTGPSPIFTAAQSGSTQVFDLTAANSGSLDGVEALRLTTWNNFGGSVLQINEFEARGNYTGKNPIFSAAQQSASQSFDLTAANAGNLSGIDALRMITLNNFGGSVLQINEVEARGVYTGGNPIFTVDNTVATNTYDLAISVNADRRVNVQGLRLTTLDNYGGSVLQINEFEGLGQLTGLTPPPYANEPDSFNCIESSTAASAASTGHLYTKVTGNAFAVDVVGLNSAGAIETNFVGTTTVELIDVSSASLTWPLTTSTCASAPAVTPSVAQNMTFGSGDAGRKSLSFNLPRAYPALACRITDTTNSVNVTNCSTDKFAVRPASITLTPAANAAAPDARATPVVKAGAGFSVGISSSPGYSGTLTLNSGVLTGSGTKVGTLAPASFTGNLSNTTATYSEVGYVYLPAGAYRDAQYTANDQSGGDCVSGSVIDSVDSTGKVGCDVGTTAVTVGRFIPDHFVTTVTPGMLCPTGQTCPTAPNGLVYSGQAIAGTVTAFNANGAVTENYAGTFAPGVTMSAWSTPASVANGVANPPSGTGVLTAAAPTFALGVGAMGATSYALPHPYNHLTPSAWTAPTNIYLRAVDLDAVASISGATTATEGITVISGRLRPVNAYGPGQVHLLMDVYTEYWNGTVWGTSVFDATPSFVTSNISGINCLGALQTGSAAPNNCSASLQAERVTANGNGRARLWLLPPGIGSVGSGDIYINGPAWLPSATGRATFGLYRGSVIYLREVY